MYPTEEFVFFSNTVNTHLRPASRCKDTVRLTSGHGRPETLRLDPLVNHLLNGLMERVNFSVSFTDCFVDNVAGELFFFCELKSNTNIGFL